MTNKTKVIAAITIVLIAAGSVFFLSGTDLMGRMKFSSPKAYDEGRHTDYKKSVADSNCNNGIDDDGDTQIDGNDPECKYAWSNEKDYNPPPRNPDPVEDPDEPEEPVEDPEPDPEPAESPYTITIGPNEGFFPSQSPFFAKDGEEGRYLLIFEISTNTDINIKNLPIYISTTGSGAGPQGLVDNSGQSNITNIKIFDYITSDVVSSVIDSADLYSTPYAGVVSDGMDDDGYYLFPVDIDLTSLTKITLVLQVDVEPNEEFAGSSITASLQPSVNYPQIIHKDTGEYLDNSEVVEISGNTPNSITGPTIWAF
jgi:hypothetical protein